MPTPEEWQKVRDKRFSEKEWEGRREIGMWETYIKLFKNIWSLFTLFSTFVLGVLLAPQVNAVADWIKEILNQL